MRREYILRGITNLYWLPPSASSKLSLISQKTSLLDYSSSFNEGIGGLTSKVSLIRPSLKEEHLVKVERRSPTSLAPSAMVTLATPTKHLKEGLSNQCWTEGFAKYVSSHDVVGASKRGRICNNGDRWSNNRQCATYFLDYQEYDTKT